MTLIKTEALILRTVPFQESSKIVRMFTREQGKIAVIAKGSRRIKSGFRGLLEPLNHIETIYYYKSTRDVQTLGNIELLNSFLASVASMESTILGMALLEIIDKIVHDHQHDSEIFDSAITHLKTMEANPDNCKFVFIRFLQNLAEILGYRLNVETCHRCRAALLDSAFYDPVNAILLCADCGQRLSSGHRLSKQDLTFLAKPTIADVGPLITEEKLRRLFIHYLSYHLDSALELKSLRMLSSLKM